ncbi:FAD-dependent monooxygenase [Streptomyces sp. NPDC052396]|uniref:FAD-dependent monooxygenase n=1 Tax=Streptomyces sp. NPDC052396 TaxID=3365689 RepID=UPI0037D04AB7
MIAPNPRPAPAGDRRFGRPRRAVVLGASMAGMLAAAALRGHAEEIVVVERDRLPAEAGPRKGLPQARHAHLLMSGGARAIESLLPGTTRRWLGAGAHRIALPSSLVALTPSGWARRWPESQFMIACSRDLLDQVVRQQALAHPEMVLRERCEVLAPLGDAVRVTGVRLRHLDSGHTESLAADLVVDATGRGSPAARWLSGLGLPAVREETVDSGLVYASRIFQAPPGAEAIPVVSVQPVSGTCRPGQGGTLLPIEGGRWLLTLAGTRGGEPTDDAGEFEGFARSLRHPLLADLIARAEPLTDVHLTRTTINRRRFHERSPSWPEGYLVLGDAVASFNPIYGQGMTVAAQCALALRTELEQGGGLTGPGLARRAQRAAARPVSGAWSLATGDDMRYPGATGNRSAAAVRLTHGYFQRLVRTAASRPAVSQALLDVMTLSVPWPALVRPRMLLHVLRGPDSGRSPAPDPPITAAERERWGLAADAP